MLSIIVCSRNEKLSDSFVENVAKTVGVDYELIGIDNSRDDYSMYSAYNEGFYRSKFPYLCFVHEDVFFHDINWGSKVIEHLKVQNVGIIGVAGGDVAPRVPAMWSLHNASENLIQSDKFENKLSEKFRYPVGYDKPRRSVVLLDGVFLCMNRSIFNHIKFDESFGGFHGYDYDISIQAIKAGLINYVIYDVSIEHFSNGIQDANYYRTLIKVFNKWQNDLAIFEHLISKEEQDRLLQDIEKRAILKLIKRLVRTGFKNKDVNNIISHFAQLTSLEGIYYTRIILEFRTFLIRITSILRRKMEYPQSKLNPAKIMTVEPKVSIITPCYNRDKFIRETLENLQKMNYKNWECIVVDDESTDKSADIIKEIASKDSRIHYHLQKKSLIPVTKNTAISLSSGKYILPLDSDDLISPDYVPEAVEILRNNPNVKIVYCDGVYFGNKKGRWELPPYTFEELLISNCIHNSAMFRRSDYDNTKGYNPVIFASEEWDLWLNLLKTGGEVYKIEKEYFFYRKHPESTIDKYSDRRAEMRKLVYENNKELYTHLIENPIQLLHEYQVYKQKYNKLRFLTFRKPIK